MSLHKKTLAITVLTIGSLMIVLFLISRFILLNSAAALEGEEVRINVERVLYAVREDLETLNNTADDRAARGDLRDLLQFHEIGQLFLRFLLQ